MGLHFCFDRKAQKAAASLVLHCIQLCTEKMNYTRIMQVSSPPISWTVQVLQFLVSHSDTIQAILRCQDVSAGSLQELALLTGILSKAALPGELTVLTAIILYGLTQAQEREVFITSQLACEVGTGDIHLPLFK